MSGVRGEVIVFVWEEKRGTFDYSGRLRIDG